MQVEYLVDTPFPGSSAFLFLFFHWVDCEKVLSSTEFLCLEDEQFLVNTNCPITVLLQYVRAKLEVAESELVDLCDEQGVLKLLLLSQQPQENASRLFSPRKTFILCTINCASDGAYVSITPHVKSPGPSLQEVLQNETDSLEKTRLKQLRALEERKMLGETRSQLSQPNGFCLNLVV
ncbi:uncharacterized protein CXorf65 homolog [Colossoma macropomum]|uniref:uncharacterized protein CXorf65 homolog n=1 Tax=Colossoma macropomum TaxID=42526 RepID=UPI001863A014|nr:uncharacterized protein CXorf65 homolog [Colossoma macropomum]